MQKQEKTQNSKETSQNEKSGLKKLVKKVLTDKNVRNAAMMSAFVATVASVGSPWAPF